MNGCHRFGLGGDISGSMIHHQPVIAEEYTDSELVSRSLAGDRDAFSRIVTRYQVLICSLAYSRIGHLGQSEDVAQETFITAWKHLRLLREPAKLRAWLCGIVHNRIHKTLRREGREPVRQAEPLELIHDAPADEALPSDLAISHEEEIILWRALEKIPELYREPLVLFYREHESIETVATQLDLTEDAVKQRLSRGRKLLQEEVQAFVENTLRRTAPGRAFSGAVLAALPIGPAASVGLSLAGKCTTIAKSSLLGVWLAALAPFLGIFAGVAAQWRIIQVTTPAGRERRSQTVQLLTFWFMVLALAVGGDRAVCWAAHHFEWNDRTVFVAQAGFWWLYIAGLIAWQTVLIWRNWAARQSREAAGEAPRFTTGTRVSLVVGMHLALFSWVIALAWNCHDLLTAGVLVGTAIGLAGWNFLSLRDRGGLAAAQVNGQHYLRCFLLILVVLNLRLDVWLATRYETSVAEIHQLFPLWLVPVLSLALLVWIALFGLIVKNKMQRAAPKTAGGV